MFTAYKVNYEIGSTISELNSDLHARMGGFPTAPDLHITITLAISETTRAMINAVYNHVYFHPLINHD